MNKIHHYPTRNCDKYNIQTSTDIFFKCEWSHLECNKYCCKYLIYAIQDCFKIISS